MVSEINNKNMKLKIISQTKKLYEGEADSVSLNTSEGMIQILPKHIDLISTLDIGEVKYVWQNSTSTIVINGGLLVVNEDNILILANEAYLSRELIDMDIDNAIKMAQDRKSSFDNPAELVQLEKQLKFERLKKNIKDNL
jgi:F-type H+-transporting ATPase subunit epsilon